MGFLRGLTVPFEAWTVTKGVREIVVMIEAGGIVPSSAREPMISTVMSTIRDFKITEMGLSGHAQAMVGALVCFGSFGEKSYRDTVLVVTEYARRHQQAALLPVCLDCVAGVFDWIESERANAIARGEIKSSPSPNWWAQ